VGGDLYWHYTSVYPAYTYLAAIDCTGHGVPGALLTMTVNSLLYSIIKDKKILNPGEILTQLHREISAALHQNLDTTRQDGLEISLIRFDPLHHTFLFSGAGLHIVLFDGKTTEFIRGDRFGIGGGRWHDELLFNEQMGNYNESSVFYMFTDGIVDQPNPQLTRRRRLGQAAWRDWIDSVTGMELAAQRVALEQYLAEMLHYHEQRDDITVMGFIPGGGGA
jgi:serine phosphatase RsbU (regulator of sigma subunit)